MKKFELKNNIRYPLSGLISHFGSDSFVGSFHVSVSTQITMDIIDQIRDQISYSNFFACLDDIELLLTENILKKVSTNVKI